MKISQKNLTILMVIGCVIAVAIGGFSLRSSKKEGRVGECLYDITQGGKFVGKVIMEDSVSYIARGGRYSAGANMWLKSIIEPKIKSGEYVFGKCYD